MVQTLESGDIAFFYRPRVEQEDPHGLEDVQQQSLGLRPHQTGGFRLPPQAGLGAGRQPDLPAELQDRFAGRRWIGADPVRLLDRHGVELVLIAADEEPRTELGVDLPAERETPQSADVFAELEVRRDAHPLEPLLTRHWE